MQFWKRKTAGLLDKHNYISLEDMLEQFSLVDILHLVHQQALDYCSYSLTKPSIKLQLLIKKKKPGFGQPGLILLTTTKTFT